MRGPDFSKRRPSPRRCPAPAGPVSVRPSSATPHQLASLIIRLDDVHPDRAGSSRRATGAAPSGQDLGRDRRGRAVSQRAPSPAAARRRRRTGHRHQHPRRTSFGCLVMAAALPFLLCCFVVDAAPRDRRPPWWFNGAGRHCFYSVDSPANGACTGVLRRQNQRCRHDRHRSDPLFCLPR